MKVFVVVICALLMSVAFVSADISDNCLQCICQVEGCEKEVGRCVMDQGSLSCGPYQIKNPYWIDCGEPGGDWQTCTKQFACSETCVRAYTRRYGTYCSGNPNPTCEVYARIHNGGPSGCKKSATIGYWNKVNACCNGKGGCWTRCEPRPYCCYTGLYEQWTCFKCA